MKILKIKEEFVIGEIITLFLNNGEKVEGSIIAISDIEIKISTFIKIYTFYDDVIAGWIKHDNDISTSAIIDKLSFVNENIQLENSLTNAESGGKEDANIEKETLKTNTIDEIVNTQKPNEIDLQKVDENTEIGERVSAIIEDDANKFIPFEMEEIPWKEDGLPEEEMFKGRNELLSYLIRHYRSPDRKKTYVLYGLTRTGKSSVLRYFSDAVLNVEIIIDRKYKFIPFLWDLSRAAAQSNAKDMWNYLLQKCTADRINTYRSKEMVNLPDDKLLHLIEFRIKNLGEIIEYLKTNGYFPIFLIDEFSYYKDLVESKKIDTSFVANFRQLSYSNLACFVYAGTYNLRRLVSDPSLSITGQFSNTIELPIGQIDAEPAMELITAFEDKVKFSESAIKDIITLSNRVPYFIQIICKNVAYYCYENRVNYIDSKDVEEVIQIIVGEKPTKNDSFILKISDGAFGNNQYDPTDTNGMVLLSSICHLSNGDALNGVGYSEIAKLWADNGMKNPNVVLNATMEDLIEKGILTKRITNDIPTYKIGVELFRRWWKNEKSSDIGMEISKLINNG